MVTIAPPEVAFNQWKPSLDKDQEAENYFDQDTNQQRLCTGVKAVDSAFDGGFDYGLVHCITSPAQHGTKELVQSLVSSHIRSSPRATATIIDSTLSFDVRRLYQMLQASMKDASEQQTLEVLDRVKITKVFDHVGATEALAEVEERLKTEAATAAALPKPATPAAPKSTIEDSDEEIIDMLDSLPKLDKAAPEEASVVTLAKAPPGDLLIIDNISQLFQPVIKNNYVHGQALLAQFMRTGTLLSRRYELCTFILSSATNKPVPKEERMSMFESCDFRPALGDELGYLVDMHFYVHQVLAKTPDESRGLGGYPEKVNMLEVISDKVGERFGRYAAFACKADGTLENVS